MTCIQSKEERLEEYKRSLERLVLASADIDCAREQYLGMHQARDYGTPVARLLNWQQESLTAVRLLIEKDIEELKNKEE